MNKVTIELTQEQLDKIRATGILNEESKWYEPKEGEYVSFLAADSCDDGIVCDEFPREILKRQRVYRTINEAQEADRKRIALTALQKEAVTKYPFTPDWDNPMQSKHFIAYEHQDREFTGGSNVCHEVFGQIYFGSRSDLDRFIKDNEENLKIVFGVK